MSDLSPIDSKSEEIPPVQEYPYPEKPVFVEDPNNSLANSLFSLALFIGVFYFIFDKDIKYVMLLVLVLFIHEMGHFLMMKYYDYSDVKMFFVPLLGAFVTGHKQQILQKQRAFILLAGPVPGIIIGVIIYGIAVIKGDNYLLRVGNIFMFLNIFNLLPVTPLDGGNLLETLFLNAKEILQTVFVVISAIALGVFAVYTESYVLLVVPFFLVSRINYQKKIKKIKVELDKDGIDYNKPFEELTNREYWLIREQVLITNPQAFDRIDPKRYVPARQEKQISTWIKSVASSKLIPDLTTAGKALFVVSWLFFGIAPFILVAVFMSLLH